LAAAARRAATLSLLLLLSEEGGVEASVVTGRRKAVDDDDDNDDDNDAWEEEKASTEDDEKAKTRAARVAMENLFMMLYSYLFVVALKWWSARLWTAMIPFVGSSLNLLFDALPCLTWSSRLD